MRRFKTPRTLKKFLQIGVSNADEGFVVQDKSSTERVDNESCSPSSSEADSTNCFPCSGAQRAATQFSEVPGIFDEPSLPRVDLLEKKGL